MQNVKIGLEIHIQLATKSKLFCSCPTFVEEANSAICEICLGYPGSKPRLNKAAFEAALKLALALNFKIASKLIFSRKTYFYPDLPKNFQITQYELPFGLGGEIEVDGQKIKLRRIHLEEDPGTIKHLENYILIDYNRSGIPLVELVTEPELESPKQARELLKTLISILKYLKIFDIDKGLIRTDANVSVAKTNWTRVEIKNILGFKEVERALDYEIKRQQMHAVTRETRGWDSEKGFTYPMRAKEFEEDYGYIIEPDLPELEISSELIKKIKSQIPELPKTKALRWIKTFGLSAVDASILASEPIIAAYFENLIKEFDPKFLITWLRHNLLGALNEFKLDPEKMRCTLDDLKEFLFLVKEGKITPLIAKSLLKELILKPINLKAYVKEKGTILEKEELLKACEEALEENKKVVEDFLAGNEKALNFIIGKAAAKLGKRAEPKILKEILLEKIKQKSSD